MIKLSIKPLSVNEAWKGRRFKTDRYKAYEKEVLFSLGKYGIPSGNLTLIIDVGFSNIQADLDNVAKLFIDILQKKYDFNDSRIYELHMRKEIVRKGNEYISYCIKSN